MAALTFSHYSDNITITHKGGNRTITVARMREIVTSYLLYYQEGATDLAIEIGSTADAATFAQRPPESFDSDVREYAAHRYELYDYCQQNSLFTIDWDPTLPTATEVAAITAQWQAVEGVRAAYELTLANLADCNAMLAESDFTDANDRRNLLAAYDSLCVTMPVCHQVKAIVLADPSLSAYGDPHRCCAHYSICWQSGGLHFHISQLQEELRKPFPDIEALDDLRIAVLSAIPAFDDFVSDILSNWG